MKPPVVIFCPGKELGDTLLTLPAIARLVEDHEHVTVEMENREVAALIPAAQNLTVRSPIIHPPTSTPNKVILSVHEGVKRFGKSHHPTTMFLRMAGYPVDEESPSVRPIVTLSTLQRMDETIDEFLDRCLEDAPSYDFLFAPFSRDMKQRGWDLWDYPAFFEGLQELYPGCTIGILGSATDRKAWDGTLAGVRKVEGLNYLYGYSLSDVIRLLKACNIAVVTIDSAVSRLCHAAEIDRHILFCSSVVPARWAVHPKATALYGKRGAGEVWGMALRIIRDGFPAQVSA